MKQQSGQNSRTRQQRDFFDTAPSFEAWVIYRYLKNRLGIVCAREGGLLDHPCAPCHPPSAPPTEVHLVGHLTNYCHQMSSCGLVQLGLYLGERLLSD